MPPVKDTHTAQVSSGYHTTLSVDSVRRLQIFKIIIIAIIIIIISAVKLNNVTWEPAGASIGR